MCAFLFDLLLRIKVYKISLNYTNSHGQKLKWMQWDRIPFRENNIFAPKMEVEILFKKLSQNLKFYNKKMCGITLSYFLYSYKNTFNVIKSNKKTSSLH